MLRYRPGVSGPGDATYTFPHGAAPTADAANVYVHHLHPDPSAAMAGGMPAGGTPVGGMPVGGMCGPSPPAMATSHPATGGDHVYVHHSTPPATVAPPPYPAMGGMPVAMGGMPYPMPMPMPIPYPMPMPAFAPCNQPCQRPFRSCQQRRSPPCVTPPPVAGRPAGPPAGETPVASCREEEGGCGGKEEKEEEEEEEDSDDDTQDGSGEGTHSQKFSKFSLASVILFVLALLLGAVCVFKTYEAHDLRPIDEMKEKIVEMMGEAYGDDAIQNLADRADRVEDRTVALGTGCAALLLFTFATLCSFNAGRQHRRRAEKKSPCQAGLLILGWIAFGGSFVNALVILVLAFDDDTEIKPELVWTALLGSFVAWLLMFGSSDVARRQGPRPRRCSKFTTVSAVLLALALMSSVACIMKTYDAYGGPGSSAPRLVDWAKDEVAAVIEERYGEENVQSLADGAEELAAERLQHRTVALATGAAALALFTAATLCSFSARMRHRAKAKKRGKRKQHCCQAGFFLASWIVFSLTFVNALLILVLAFDEDTVIQPEMVWSALIGSAVAWMLMFGSSEMARRT